MLDEIVKKPYRMWSCEQCCVGTSGILEGENGFECGKGL